MNLLLNFLCGCLLGGLDLLGLYQAVQSLGARISQMRMIVLFLFLFFKLGILILGVRWASQQAWFGASGFFSGLLFPFAGLVSAEIMRLFSRTVKKGA